MSAALAANSGSVLKAPAAAPLQVDPVPAEDPPDVVLGDVAERPREQPCGPHRLPPGDRLVELGEDPQLGLLGVLAGSAAAGGVDEAFEAHPREAQTPLADRGRADLQVRGDGARTHAVRGQEDDAAAEGQPLLGLCACLL